VLAITPATVEVPPVIVIIMVPPVTTHATGGGVERSVKAREGRVGTWQLSSSTAAAAAVCLLLACGSGGGGGGGGSGGQGGGSGPGGSGDGGGRRSGVDGTRNVTSLTDAEKTMVCNWFADLLGGYGAADACDAVAISAPPSRVACLARFPSCDARVAVLESCFGMVVEAEQSCSAAAQATAAMSPDCMVAAPCVLAPSAP
jgi:hypothetical protein